MNTYWIIKVLEKELLEDLSSPYHITVNPSKENLEQAFRIYKVAAPLFRTTDKNIAEAELKRIRKEGKL